MALWGWAAGVYGGLLAVTAVTLTGVERRFLVFTACLAYALLALGAATIDVFWIHLFVPAVLLLAGYWLSGLFFKHPQPWLETWLVRTDRDAFDTLRVNRALEAVPHWVLELLEASYTADYAVVAAGALIAAAAGQDEITRYWSIVLAAELACYAALPFLRSRPPRAIEPAGVVATRAPRLRRLNTAILDRASVQANTIPSGHVAGAVAAALATMPVSATAAAILMILAGLITAAAFAGRYHYAVDCVLGVIVAVGASVLLS
jgi:hypothetical protein